MTTSAITKPIAPYLNKMWRKDLSIIFDLDDTLFNASYHFRNVLLEQYNFVAPGYDVYLTSENTNGYLDRIIKDGQYLADMPLFTELADLPQLLTKLRLQEVPVHVCTHRKGTESNVQHTLISFKKYELVFDKVHFLDSSTYPNKIEYLSKKLGHTNFVLFCDNPHHGQLDLSPYANQLRLVNSYHNQHLIMPSSHRVNVNEIIPTVEKLLWVQ